MGSTDEFCSGYWNGSPPNAVFPGPTWNNILCIGVAETVELVPVAQLDRASDYGSEGRGFESSRAYEIFEKGLS